jgi:hypothetical protein
LSKAVLDLRKKKSEITRAVALSRRVKKDKRKYPQTQMAAD